MCTYTTHDAYRSPVSPPIYGIRPIETEKTSKALGVRSGEHTSLGLQRGALFTRFYVLFGVQKLKGGNEQEIIHVYGSTTFHSSRTNFQLHCGHGTAGDLLFENEKIRRAHLFQGIFIFHQTKSPVT